MFEHFDAKIDTYMHIAELVTTTVQTRREVSELGPRVVCIGGVSANAKTGNLGSFSGFAGSGKIG
jgi:hypothetical protein